MTKSDFARLFLQALERGAEKTEEALKRPVPRSYAVRLHYQNASNSVLTPEQALDILYLGDDRFFRIIDVGVTEISAGKTVVFVRPSGHAPDDFARTWDPRDLGPFKHILFKNIRFDSETLTTY